MERFRKAAPERPCKQEPGGWDRFEERIQQGWSLEQIVGQEKLDGGPGVKATWLNALFREDRASNGTLYH